MVASGALFILLADWCLTRSYSDLICDDELFWGQPQALGAHHLPVATVEATRLRSGGLHSLIKFEVCGQCQDTASRFIEAVPTYRLDWIVVSYSRVAIGTLIDRC